ncbi:hypothetical protein M405DRAFT_832319 [Rhizopogon salebrosus TDB-379]|nr:hypothetical protein M405DRAFT_832319 [Rhizopogon salebrosus TDB-379]
MAHLTTRSILLRKPQYPDYLVEETSARPSSRELDAGVHHRGSYQVYMEPCLRWHQLQNNECIVRWFNSPVDKRWRPSRRALEK